MSKELLKQFTVRITVNDGNTSIVGSGVILKNRIGVYHILTAEHCIFGKKNNRLKNITEESISAEYKINNSEDFKQISINKIIYDNTGNDIALIEITPLDVDHDNLLCSNLTTETDCNNVHFRGFPKWLNQNGGAKTYSCLIEENDIDTFHLKSEEVKDDSSHMDVEETTNGLSGSGVFEIKNGKLFLIGIITNLRDENATFGHLQCIKLNDIFTKFDFETFPLSDKAQQLFLKSISLDRESTKQRIEELRESKNERFNNLYTKCTEHIYNEEDADKMVDKILYDYFSTEISLKFLGKLNSFIQDDFDKTMAGLSKGVEKNFNKRTVSDYSEAQAIIFQVKQYFVDIFKGENKNTVELSFVRDLSENAVTELLLNCDLNFIKK
jgi:hypothetical protein